MSGPSEAGSLADLKGVGEKTQSRLREAGIESIQELASKSVEDLAEIPRLGQKTAQQLIDQAEEWVASISESESLPEVETVQEEDQIEEASSAEEVMEPEAASEPETDSEEEAEKTT